MSEFLGKKFFKELPHTVGYWMDKWEENEPVEALSTGLPSLDRALGGGLIAGQVMTVGASTGCGKSSFGVNLGCRVAEQGLPVMIFTFEMTVPSLASRVNQTYSGVNAVKIDTKTMTDAELQCVQEAKAYMKDIPLYITGAGGSLHPDNIALAMQEAVDELGIELFIFDHIQKMNKAAVDQRQFGIEAAMDAIDHAAKYVVEKPVCVLSQLNRAAGRSGEPTRYDLRDSGSIENASDIVMLIDPVEEKPLTGWHGPTEFNFIIDKQRSGGGAVVPVTFLPHRVSFVEDE